MDSDLELVEIEYGYVKRDRRILVRATQPTVDALVAEVHKRGWQARTHSVEVFDIAGAREALLADVEGR